MLTRVLATASRSLRLTRNAVRHQSASASSPGVVELREYVLKPEFIGEYMKISTEGGDLRKRLVPLRLFGNPETGDTLNLAQHFYHYSDLTERQEARDAAQVDPDWQEYIGAIRPHVAVQKSTIYVEAPFVYEGSLELSGMSEEFVHSDGDKPGVYELRRFRVNPGGGSVLAFLDMFEDAAKLEVQNAADGSALKTVLVSEVGDGSEVGSHQNLLTAFMLPHSCCRC